MNKMYFTKPYNEDISLLKVAYLKLGVNSEEFSIYFTTAANLQFTLMFTLAVGDFLKDPHV